MPTSESSGQFVPTLSGYAAAILFVISESVSTTCVQALRHSIPDFQLNVCRYIIQLAISFAISQIRGTPLKVDRDMHGGLCLLVITNVIYNVGFFGGTAMIPLSAANATFNVTIMIGVTLGSKLFLRIRVGVVQWISMCFCICGVCCISQPGPIFKRNMASLDAEGPWNKSWNMESDSPLPSFDNHELHTFTSLLGYSLVVMAGFADALFSMTIGISLAHFDPVALTMWVSIFGIPVSLIVSFYFEQPVLSTEPIEHALLWIHCVFATVTIIASSYASQALGPLGSNLVGTIAPLILLIPQYTLMKHIMPGHMNWLEVAGVIITVVGVALSPMVDIFLQYKKKGCDIPYL